MGKPLPQYMFHIPKLSFFLVWWLSGVQTSIIQGQVTKQINLQTYYIHHKGMVEIGDKNTASLHLIKESAN